MSTDRFTSRHFATTQPEKLQTLVEAWFEEAEKNWIVTLDELSAAEILAIGREADAPLPAREASRR